MEDFFKKLSFGKGKDDKDKKKQETKKNDNKNPLQNLFQPQQPKQPKRIVTGGGVLGTGSSGTSDSSTVQTFCFVESGPLGIKVEKSQSNGAIISQVLPNTPASEAGLLRGDVICFPESSGTEQILYNQFLAMIKSNQRPVSFDARRILTSSKKKDDTDNGEHLSADAYVKRQAMIAAAEARERKFNTKMGKTTTTQPKKPPQQTTIQQHQKQPMSEEAKIAVQKAKVGEIQDVQNLGFNPYETATVTAGKAKKTATDMMHGEMGNWDGQTTLDSEGKPNHIPKPPKNKPLSIYEPFDSAFLSYQSTNPPATFSTSLKILTKLLHNVISDPDHDIKFRRVRLSNPKIKANVVDVQGAMDIMMLFGFVLVEEEETCLIYEEDGLVENRIWRGEALEYMKNYTVD